MRRSAAFAAVLLATLTGALLYVKARMLRVELSYALQEKRAERAKLEQERQALQMELALLKSPARIEKLAKEKLRLKRTLSQVSQVAVTPEGKP